MFNRLMEILYIIGALVLVLLAEGFIGALGVLLAFMLSMMFLPNDWPATAPFQVLQFCALGAVGAGFARMIHIINRSWDWWRNRGASEEDNGRD